MGKITPLPQTRSLSALLDQPLDPVRSVRITADLAMGRLLLKHQHIKPSDSSLRMRGALWVVALLSGDRALQRPLVPLLRVRHRIISMRPYQLMLFTIRHCITLFCLPRKGSYKPQFNPFLHLYLGLASLQDSILRGR